MKHKNFSDYDNYIKEHRQNVKNAYEYLKLAVLPAFDFPEEDKAEIEELISVHDMSKYRTNEFFAYNDYFYGNNRTQEVEKDFNYAWLYHIHSNPHHWQYWLLPEDDGDLKALDMPIQYIIEMICDWWSFSWSKNDLFEIFRWYEKNKDNQNLSDKTRKVVEDILHEMKTQITYYPEGVFNEK